MNNLDNPPLQAKLSNHVINRTAKRPRLARLISAFLSNTKGLTAKQVGKITGASNPYAEIEFLRVLGWSIFNTRHRGTDRDGKVCHFARYNLSENQRVEAHKVLIIYNEG